MKKYIYTFLALVLVSTFWYSCTPPLEGITLQLPQSIAKSNVIIEFKPDNASAGDLPKDLKVRIGGQDSSKVVNITGGKTFKIKQNFLTLAANPSITPTKSSPIKFSIIVEAEGYLRSITPVEITNTEDQVLRVELTKISAPPTGITVAQQTSTIPSSGTTSTAITVSTPANNGIVEKSTVTIPNGIKLSDEKGSVVGGNVNIVVSKADASKTLVGIDYSNISKVVNSDNQPLLKFTVTPIIGLDVEISNDKSQKVKTFSGNIEIISEIPNNIKNPKTGKVLQEGDYVVITSLDEDTKVSKFEGFFKVYKNAEGKLEVKGTINHLTEIFITPDWGLIVDASTLGNITAEEIKQRFLKSINAIEEMKSYNFEFSRSYISIGISIFPESNNGSWGSWPLGSENEKYKIVVDDYMFGYGQSVMFPSINRDMQIKKVVVYDLKGNEMKRITTISGFNDVGGVNKIPLISNISETSFGMLITIPVPLPIKVIANLKCNDLKKSTNVDNIFILARVAGTTKDYEYIAKAIKNTDGTVTATSTNILKRGGKYDFKFEIGGISLYRNNETIPNDDVYKINVTMPDTFCK